jgi:hypothetical protein
MLVYKVGRYYEELIIQKRDRVSITERRTPGEAGVQDPDL